VEHETLTHVVHKVLRYILESEKLRLGSHVLQYILKRCVLRVLVSHVPQYILKLCVLRVLVSQVPHFILKLCVQF
jgi:hypothetical protein